MSEISSHCRRALGSFLQPRQTRLSILKDPEFLIPILDEDADDDDINSNVSDEREMCEIFSRNRSASSFLQPRGTRVKDMFVMMQRCHNADRRENRDFVSSSYDSEISPSVRPTFVRRRISKTSSMTGRSIVCPSSPPRFISARKMI